jgi:Uma2 family endonuclease
MAVGQRPVTAEELLQNPDDGLRRELVRGEVRSMALADSAHGRIAINLAWSLADHVKSQNLGVVFAAETGFKIFSDRDTVRAPDAAFVRRERIEAVGGTEGYWPGAPDLAVEVVSPNDRFAEVEEKSADWLSAGSRMVLIANPRGRTGSEREALFLSEEETIEGGEVVPGWILPVADVFR